MRRLTRFTRLPRTLDAATLTWLALLALLALTLLGVLAASQGTAGATRLAMAWAVAALCALKARLLAAHYLHAQEAGPVFSVLIRAFALLAPLGLAASALREWWLG